MRPGLPSLRAPVPPLLFLYVSSLRFPLLVLSGLGRNVGTLTQTLKGHAGASGLVEITPRGLARQRGPAFTSGVDGRTIRSCWCRGVSRRRRPLLLHPLFSLEID